MQQWQELKKRLKPWLRKAPGFRAASFVYWLVSNQEFRNTTLMMRRPPEGLFQPYGSTSNDRYPYLFQQVRERIGDGANLRILSFGCATGEEVFSLRRVFPLANITGLDINPYNISVCRSRLRRIKESKLSFAVAGSTTGEASASYDAIFAMAVYRHGKLNVPQPPPKCEPLIHFTDFEQSVTDLARCLKPGGLLIIQHAMFRFADTRLATEFEPILSVFPPQYIQLYDRDNCNLPNTFYPDVMFRKLE